MQKVQNNQVSITLKFNAGKRVHYPLNARAASREFNRQIDYIEAKILLPK